MGYLRVHFNDEAPTIGSGRRLVFVESFGPRWVRIRSPWTYQSAKIARDVWDTLPRATVSVSKAAIENAALVHMAAAEERSQRAAEAAQTRADHKLEMQGKPPAKDREDTSWQGFDTFEKQYTAMLMEAA